MSAPDAAAQSGTPWDEAQCTAALARLEQLQAQIDDLRLAVPRVIEPFHRPPNATTFKLYAQGVVSSQDNIKSLSKRWKDSEIQSTFEHVKQSFGANSDLAACVSIPAYGWIERERKERDTKKKGRSGNVDVTVQNLTDEDFSEILVDFQKAYPGIILETSDSNNSISTRFVSGSIKLNFQINIEREANGRHKLAAVCHGTTEPFLTVTRCIMSRPNANDLKYLLDMIAAYKTVKGLSCAKCGQLLDNSTLTPLARRSEQIAGANDMVQIVWKAFHESCLD